jgi:hypothetical protein
MAQPQVRLNEHQVFDRNIEHSHSQNIWWFLANSNQTRMLVFKPVKLFLALELRN